MTESRIGTRMVERIAIAWLMVCAGCSPPQFQFWIPSGAVVDMGPETDQSGLAEIGFHLTGADRNDIVNNLSAALEAQGWRRRAAIRPAGAPPLPPDGWETFSGGGVYDPTWSAKAVSYWSGEWERAGGEVVNYRMSYATLPSNPHARIDVYATYRRDPQ